ncbi:MAG: efflux RND transporter permease subunit [Gemmiger sp.]
MSKYSVKRPFTVLVGVVLVLVLGVVSLLRMPTDLLPGISLPYLMVVTTYPGASPEKVESEVSAPLEEALGTVNGVESVSSTSNENYSMVMLEFSEDTDLDSAMVKASAAINQLADTLPETAGTPTLLELSVDMMATEYIAVDYQGMDIYALSDYVEQEVIPALERVDGVASVSASGLVEKTVEVTLNQEKIDRINDKLLVKVSDRLAEAEAELRDAEKKLNDSAAELADGKQQLADGRQQLADGKAALEEQQAALDKTQKDTADQLAQTSQQLDEAMATIAALNVQLQAAESEKAALDETMAKLEAQDAAYKDLDAKLKTLWNNHRTELSGAGFDWLETGVEGLAGTGVPSEIEGRLNGLRVWLTTKSEALEAVDEPVPPEMTELSAALEGLAAQDILAMKLAHDALAETEELRQAAAAKLEELAAAKAALDQQADALREAYKQLEAGKINAAAGFGSGSAQLAAGLAGLESAGQQLDATEAQLESGEEQIQSGRDQLADARKEYEAAREEALKNANMDQLLNMATLAQLIGAQNFSMPAGYVQDGDTRYMLKVGDAFGSVEELSGALLCTVDGVGDVRLSDVADITVTDNSGDTYAKVDKNQAVVLSVFKGSTASTSEVSDLCNEKMAALMAADPDLHLTVIMDQGDYIRLIIRNVLSNLLWGAALAVIVLALFLKDLRPTLVVAVSIPLSVLFAIVLMYFTGITLNMISLSGLALGIGMLVDNSIVVIENIYRLRSRGVPAPRAAVQGARQVAGAIAASTLTTICVFLPVVFTDGLTRTLLLDMALTITFSLGASLAVALTVVPAAGSTILRRARDIRHPWFDRVLAGYEKALRAALRVKAVPLVLAVVLLAGSMGLLFSQGIVLIPTISSNQVSVTLSLPDGTADEDAFAVADEAMDRMMAIDGIKTVGAMSDSGTAGMMGMSGMSGAGSNTSFSYYILLDEDAGVSQARVEQAILDATADLGAQVSVGGGASDMSALMGSGVEVNIYGNDLDTLLEVSAQVEALMAEVEGITDISNGQETGDPVVRIVVDKDKAMRLGLTVAQIYMELAQALTTNTTSTTLTAAGDTYTVEIIDTTKTPDLSNIFLHEFTTTTMDEDGQSVEETHTLGEFASRVNAPGVASIQRANLTRYITVTSATQEGYNTTLLSREVQSRLDALALPEGCTVEIGGETTQVANMLSQMAQMLLLALVLIYLVMVAQFQSLLSPFIVLFTVPLAFTGGALGLLAAGEPVSLMSLMGFLVLMGVVVNNGIVFVDYTNQLRIGGLSRHEALVATGRTRMRPILMTTLTTVLAMITMLFSSDAGSELGRGMAIVIVSGLLYATLMTLFVVPVIYDILFKKNPTNVDVGDDGMDDLPDDAAEFAARLGRPESGAPLPPEDNFPDFPIEKP